MKSKFVLELLDCSRNKLSYLTTEGKIKGTKLPNGQYDYDEDSIYKYIELNKLELNKIAVFIPKNDKFNENKKIGFFEATLDSIPYKTFTEESKLITACVNKSVKEIHIMIEDKFLSRAFLNTYKINQIEYGKKSNLVSLHLELDSEFNGPNEIFCNTSLINLQNFIDTFNYKISRDDSKKILDIKFTTPRDKFIVAYINSNNGEYIEKAKKDSKAVHVFADEMFEYKNLFNLIQFIVNNKVEKVYLNNANELGKYKKFFLNVCKLNNVEVESLYLNSESIDIFKDKEDALKEILSPKEIEFLKNRI